MSRRYLLLLPIPIGSVAYSAPLAQDASAETPECADLRRQINDLEQERHELRRQEQARRDQLLANQRDIRAAQRDLINMRFGAGDRTNLALRLESLDDLMNSRAVLLEQAEAAVQRRNAGHVDAEQRPLQARYANECQDPPDDCERSAAPTPVSTPVPTGSPTTRLDASTVTRQLFEPIRGLPPVAAQIRPDGTVVYLFSGEPVPNPANPGAPLTVQFDTGSPFHPGQVVTVSYSQVQLTTDPSQQVSLVRFNGPSGSELRYAPSNDRAVREIPSARDIFPNGFFAIPTVPAGAIVPLGRAAIGSRARSAFEFLQELIDAAAPARVPLSSRLEQPGGGCSCSATAASRPESALATREGPRARTSNADLPTSPSFVDILHLRWRLQPGSSKYSSRYAISKSTNRQGTAEILGVTGSACIFSIDRGRQWRIEGSYSTEFTTNYSDALVANDEFHLWFHSRFRGTFTREDPVVQFSSNTISGRYCMTSPAAGESSGKNICRDIKERRTPQQPDLAVRLTTPDRTHFQFSATSTDDDGSPQESTLLIPRHG